MTPQAFSFPTLGNNSMIYVPPYGLKEVVDYMLKINPVTYEVTKIPLEVDSSREKWQYGNVVGNKIVWLPYNESRILILNTDDDSIEYKEIPFTARGKYIRAHVYKNKVIALPYGEIDYFDVAISYDVETKEVFYRYIYCEINDEKKWHTSQLVNGKIYGVPRGERVDQPFFPYRIEMNCDTLDYRLEDLSGLWSDYDETRETNKKFTTMAKVGDKLYAPPYSENPNFDIMLKFDGKAWTHERTGLQQDSRKYFSSTSANNGKVYCPPAGHEETWSDLLIIDSLTDTWKTVSLGIGKESKKYFTGWENSQGKIYWIPRGGCVCQPEDLWKQSGDLAEVLVVDTKDDSFYTVDISDSFVDNTTIEKFNASVIINDKIFAFPYGQSESFQTVLVFDTRSEKVIKEIDLNEI